MLYAICYTLYAICFMLYAICYAKYIYLQPSYEICYAKDILQYFNHRISIQQEGKRGGGGISSLKLK